MKLGRVLLIILVAFVGAVVLVGGCVLSGYNRAITLDEGVKQAWAQVENQMQRRFELVPNLVETVKGVAGQEEKIYLGVAEARKAYFQADKIGDKAQAAGRWQLASHSLTNVVSQRQLGRRSELALV